MVDLRSKTAGIIGGISPESTIAYYRQIVAGYQAQRLDGSFPSVVINSIDMTKMLRLISADQLPEVTAYLLAEVQRLAQAGATFGVLSSNTPHVVFDALSAQSPIPLISIVTAARQAAAAKQIQRVALFGTRFTMGGRFYADAFAAQKMQVVSPTLDEQAYIHDKYMTELVVGRFLPETRLQLQSIAQQMRTREGVEALLLGGTELPLLLSDETCDGMPILDTTRIHTTAIVAEMLRR